MDALKSAALLIVIVTVLMWLGSLAPKTTCRCGSRRRAYGREHDYCIDCGRALRRLDE